MVLVNILNIHKVYATTEETLPQSEVAETPTEPTTTSSQATAIVIEIGQIKELQTDHVTKIGRAHV